MTFRRLLGFLRPYRGQVITSTLLAVFAQAAGLTIPYLTGQVIDTVSAASHSDRRLFTYAALVVAAGVVKGVLMIVVLEHGEVIEAGTHAELIERQGRYFSLYDDWVEAVA